MIDTKVNPVARLVEWVLLGFFLFAVGYGALLPLQEFDIWLHLKTGEQILRTGSIPRADIYSFTAAGREWLYHEWGFALPAFIIFKHFAVAGLLALQAGLVVGIFIVLTLLVWQVVNNRQTRTLLTIGLLIPGYAMMQMRFSLRPHLLSIGLLGTVLFLLYRGGRARWLIPFLFVLWSNLHGDFVWGLAVLLLWAVAAVINHGRAGYRDLIIWLAAVAASMLNPYGAKLFYLAWQIGSFQLFQQHVQEWQPPTSDIFLTLILPYLALLLFGSFLVWPRRRLFEHVLVMIGVLAMMKAQRYLPMGFCFGLPLLAFAGRQLTEYLLRLTWRRWLLPLTTFALLILFVRFMLPSGIDWGIMERVFPFPAYQFLRDNRLAGRTLATYEYGTGLTMTGYPDNPHYIDGRWDVFGEDRFRAYLELMQGVDYRNELTRWGIDVVLLKVAPFTFAQDEQPVALLAYCLANDSDWGLVFADDLSLVFIRRAAFPNQTVYYKAWPLLAPAEVAAQWERFAVELERLVAGSPYHSWAYQTAGAALKAGGNNSAAISCYVQALRDDRENSVLLAELADCWLQAGELTAAAVSIQAARNFDPHNYLVDYYLGRYQLRTGNYQAGTQNLRLAVELAPYYDQARVELAAGLLAQNDFAGAENVLAAGYALTRNPKLLLAWGGVYQQRQDFAGAAPLLRAYLRSVSGDTQARYALGSCYLSARQFPEALQVYLELGGLGEESARYHSDLGGIYIVLNDFARARGELARALKLEPDNPRARHNRELLRQRETAVILFP